MKTITIIFFLTLFFLLRPHALEAGNMWYQDDDHDYFAHASAIVFGHFPSYKNEFFVNKNTPMGAVGTGLMASPFVFSFSLIDRASGGEIVQKRTRDSIVKSWTLFGFMISTVCFFWWACAFLYKGLRWYFSCQVTRWSIALMIFCQGLPLFAFRRPVFSHIYEFFLQSVLVYFLLKAAKFGLSWKNFNLKQKLLIGLVCGLVFLVRYNNIFIALIWPILLSGMSFKDLKDKKLWRYFGLIYGCIGTLFVIFKLWPTLLAPETTYLNNTIQRVGILQPPLFYLKRLGHVLLGPDWGLVYTAPFAIAALAMLSKQNDIERKLIWAIVPLLVNLYCVLAWQTQGGWYGYRYLIASFFPLIIFFFAKLLHRVHLHPQRPKILFTLLVISTLPLLSMICFEAKGGYFGQLYYAHGWGNPFYQLHVWQTLLFKPFILFNVISFAGPAYLLFVSQSMLSFFHLTVTPVYDEYAYLNLVTLGKMLCFYALPFVLYWLWKRNQTKTNT